MKRSAAFLKLTYILMAALLFSGVNSASADDLDPLLKLLIKKGIITESEAHDLQAESQAAEPAPAAAPAAPRAEAKAASSWTDKLDFGGDFRLRYEGFNQKGSFDNGRRDRFRFRLRTHLKAAITDTLTTGFELRTGSPIEPVSNNVTLGSGLTSKDFRIAQAYLQYRPGDRFGLIGGKFDPKHWWTVSDLQWDDDVTLEGVMADFGIASGDGGFKGLDMVAYGSILNESAGSSDASVFGAQLRSDFRFGNANSLRVGTGFEDWENPQQIVDLTTSGRLGPNHVTNFLDAEGNLISDFKILNLFAEYKCATNPTWPVKVSAFYYKNLGANGIGKDHDTAYFGRVQVGETKRPYQLALRYTYYHSEPDALFYAFVQDDTARATDVKAHRFDLQLGFIAKSSFNLTWYITKPLYAQDQTLNRWQLDYIVKF